MADPGQGEAESTEHGTDRGSEGSSRQATEGRFPWQGHSSQTRDRTGEINIGLGTDSVGEDGV